MSWLLAKAAPPLIGAPGPLLKAVLGAPPVNDEGHPLDLHTWALLRARYALGLPETADQTVLEAREASHAKTDLVGGPRLPVRRVEELRVPGPGGDIPARFYQQHDSTPLLVYLHGGGWVVGSPDTHDHLCRRLCRQASVSVLSVHYRLAPEHRFPAGLQDAVAAWTWALSQAPSLRVDPTRAALGGDSAGANLTAAAVLELRQHGLRLPAVQLLFYPATDLHLRQSSHQSFAEGYLITHRDMLWYIDHYVRGPEDLDHPRASICQEPDLSGLPRAIVRTAGFDPLRDEGRQHAERLTVAGVEVDYADAHGLVHGWANMAGIIPEAELAVEEVAERLGVWLRE